MGKCTVKSCNSRSENNAGRSGVSFHSIPKDPERRVNWTRVIRLLRHETDWIPTRTTVICSKHFRNEHKTIFDNNRVSLTKDAVPFRDEDVETQALEPSHNIMSSDVEIETDEEMEQITETPKEQSMRKTIDHLKLVASKRLKVIKNISQKIRRLKINNKKLKDVIEELKGKRMLSEEEEMQLNLNEETLELME